MMSLVNSFPVKPRIWPDSAASSDLLDGLHELVERRLLGVVAQRGRHHAHAVAHLGEHRDLALVVRIEEVVDRLRLALDLVLAVDDPGEARLPRHRVLALGVEGRRLEPVDQVLARVGQLGLVELLHVAQADHARGHPVGDHVDVAPARVAALVLLADLAEELGVVVDLLDVLDLGPVLLLELLEGAAVLLDVEGPVGEVEGVRDLALGDRLAARCSPPLGAAPGLRARTRPDRRAPTTLSAPAAPRLQQAPPALSVAHQALEVPLEVVVGVMPRSPPLRARGRRRPPP